VTLSRTLRENTARISSGTSSSGPVREHRELRRKRDAGGERGRGSISYEIIGEGQPWVITPGGRFSKDHGAVREMAQALAARGKRVLIWDRPNCGASDVWFHGDSESAMQADSLAGLLRQLDFGPAVIIGGSGGARVSLLTVAQHPDVVSGVAMCWMSGGPFGLMTLGVHHADRFPAARLVRARARRHRLYRRARLHDLRPLARRSRLFQRFLEEARLSRIRSRIIAAGGARAAPHHARGDDHDGGSQAIGASGFDRGRHAPRGSLGDALRRPAAEAAAGHLRDRAQRRGGGRTGDDQRRRQGPRADRLQRNPDTGVGPDASRR
jgi:pimeloyl-ACP methyl ester carboxylesterase